MQTNFQLGMRIFISLLAIGLLTLGFVFPTASFTENGITSELYLTKECISIDNLGKECGENSSIFRKHLWALYGIYISLIILISLGYIACALNHMVLCDVIGILILGLSITVIIMLALIYNFHRGTIYYKLSPTSILIMIACFGLVLHQLACNKLLHKTFMGPIRMITLK
jgi:hypothetical protein